jgi:hypothetical protein
MTAKRHASDPSPGAEAAPQPESGTVPPDKAASDLRERLDQVGTILSKGLDLAEAGVSLGVTIVNRIGTIAQKQVLDQMMAAATQPSAAAPTDVMSDRGVQPPPSPGLEPDPPPQEPTFFITNRLPLSPGGAVKVSFSINNDSIVAPKKVALRIEGFMGEVTGASLPAAAISVKPPARTIAPVDFEKFTLRGIVPAETLPDVYLGWVVVDSEEQLRIPLRLNVSP